MCDQSQIREELKKEGEKIIEILKHLKFYSLLILFIIIGRRALVVEWAMNVAVVEVSKRNILRVGIDNEVNIDIFVKWFMELCLLMKDVHFNLCVSTA